MTSRLKPLTGEEVWQFILDARTGRSLEGAKAFDSLIVLNSAGNAITESNTLSALRSRILDCTRDQISLTGAIILPQESPLRLVLPAEAERWRRRNTILRQVREACQQTSDQALDTILDLALSNIETGED